MKLWSVLLLFLLMPAVAAADISFEAGINVSAEAENASLAKEDAMKKAYREAFLKVSSRLTTAENVEKLNELTDAQLSHFVQEVSVIAEHSGTKTYRADLNIKINEKLLKQYMQENDMLEVVAAPAKVLIVPVYSDTAYPDKVIWEDGNLWRQAWLDKGLIKSGAYDFFVVSDTPANRAVLSDTDLNREVYDKLISLNHVKDVFVVNAVRAGRNTLAIVIRSHPETEEKRLLITDENGETFDKGIAETIGYITLEMQGRTVEENSRRGNLEAVYHFNRLPEWLDMEKRLNHVPQIKNVRIETMGSHQVKTKIEFSGSESRLRASLENAGIYLQSDNGRYILR